MIILFYQCISSFDKNICQAFGLNNGATAKIITVLYGKDTPPPGLAKCMICDFGKSYTGPPFFGDDEDKNGWVPIFPCTHTEHVVTNNNKVEPCTRTMFPLRLSSAWTPWKAQGQTMPGKVASDLGCTEKEHGLTYTVFTRVTKCSNLDLINGITFDRLTKCIKNQKKLQERLKEEKRLQRK